MAMLVPDHIITFQGSRRRRSEEEKVKGKKSPILARTEEREFSVGEILGRI